MTVPMRLATLGGRVVLGLVFLLPGLMAARDWYDGRLVTYTYKLPAPDVTVPLVIGVGIVGGMGLVLGFRARFFSLLLILMLILLTSGQFGLTGGQTRVLVESSDLLLARIGLIGALLFVFGTGGGPYRLSRQ